MGKYSLKPWDTEIDLLVFADLDNIQVNTFI